MGRRFLLALAAAAIGGDAAAQIKPRFVLLFDTSGSMTGDSDGYQTYGDGSVEHPGLDRNCDGLPNDSRLYQADNAASSTISSFGEVQWALVRYSQVVFSSLTGAACDPTGWECCTYYCYDDPTNNTGPALCSDTYCAGTVLIRNVDGSTDGCTYYGGRACGDAAAGADILVGFASENMYQILMWMDHAETDHDTTTTTGAFCTDSGGAVFNDCELRGVGPTPIAYAIDDVNTYLDGVRAGDPDAACRTYAVILLTDGVESCVAPGTLYSSAASLYSDGVSLYVIGFSTAPGDAAQLNNIADNGGTGSAYFADDEAELSLALATIVGGSIPYELCNGADDDCDGLADEDFPGLGTPCGTGVCAGTLECSSDGTGTVCTGGSAPSAEVCDGVDNDCDGVIDEGCVPCAPQTEVCNGDDDDCDLAIDEDYVSTPCDGADGDFCDEGTSACSGGAVTCSDATGTTVEACNCADDDCDGSVDEGLSQLCYDYAVGCDLLSGDCEGTCQLGYQTCSAALCDWGACTDQIGPALEVCNGLDDDCDGTVDEGVCIGCTGETCNGEDDDCDGFIDEDFPESGLPCGTSEGPCEPGVYICDMGALDCDGAIGPTAEVCNGIDDDCDGTVDEGTADTGAACGDDVGACDPGTTVCLGGAIVCVGDIGPVAEICNGDDDDCDGETDEEFPEDGDPCGSSVGVCLPGIWDCDGGALVCDGGVLPTEEECNELDDDCDGSVDEGVPGVGGECDQNPNGDPDEGACEPGTVACVDGEYGCTGGLGPSEEVCNGIDDDCDGEVDEGAECPEDAECIDGGCAEPCDPTEEFPCPGGDVCVGGLCVPDVCAGFNCGDDERCEADEEGNPVCVDLCAGVTCDAFERCDNGACVDDSCATQECPEGEICVEYECRDNPCADVECAEGEYCAMGLCRPLCYCEDDQLCDEDGRCSDDPCAGQACPYGEACGDDGECAPDPCAAVGDCPPGDVCDGGNCVTDPCLVTDCYGRGECISGKCYAGREREEPRATRVLATGVGGCACRVGSPRPPPALFLAVTWLLGAGLVSRSRRRR